MPSNNFEKADDYWSEILNFAKYSRNFDTRTKVATATENYSRLAEEQLKNPNSANFIFLRIK
jgi:hypothetical protein